ASTSKASFSALLQWRTVGAGSAKMNLNAELVCQTCLGQHCVVCRRNITRIDNLYMVGLMTCHHLVTGDAIEYAVHHRPFSIGEIPASLGFLTRKRHRLSAADIHFQPPIFHIDARPDHLTGLGDTTKGAATFTKKHRRLPHRIRSSIATLMMSRRCCT